MRVGLKGLSCLKTFKLQMSEWQFHNLRRLRSNKEQTGRSAFMKMIWRNLIQYTSSADVYSSCYIEDKLCFE